MMCYDDRMAERDILLVEFRRGTSIRQQNRVLALVHATRLAGKPLDQLRVRVPAHGNQAALDSIATLLCAFPEVAWVQPNVTVDILDASP